MLSTIPRVEMVDSIQRREVGDAREAERGPDQERDPRISLAEHSQRQRLGRLAGLLLRLQLPLPLPPPPFSYRQVAPGSQNPGDRDQQQTDEQVLERADLVPRGALDARSVESEHDHHPGGDARRVRAQQITEHQPLRTREQQHHGHRRQQRRVGHRNQRQQEDFEQIAAHNAASVGTEAPSLARSSVFAIDQHTIGSPHQVVGARARVQERRPARRRAGGDACGSEIIGALRRGARAHADSTPRSGCAATRPLCESFRWRYAPWRRSRSPRGGIVLGGGGLVAFGWSALGGAIGFQTTASPAGVSGATSEGGVTGS